MMENASATVSTVARRAGFSAWLEGDAGAMLARYEREKISGLLSGLLGYHIAQIGRYDGEALSAASGIRNKIELHLDIDGACDSGCGLLASAGALPFAGDSVDVVLLPHVLEFTPDTDALLKEIERILIEDGRLIIVGFNPWSLWGLWRANPLVRNRSPWNGCFHTTLRLGHWLSMLDFEVLEVHRFLFRPPCERKRLLQRLAFLETLGKYCWPWLGAAYIVVVQKRRIPVTPIKMNWRRRIFLSGASAESATMVAASDEASSAICERNEH